MSPGMTENEARALCAQRQAEHPQFSWIVQQRATGDWIVARLPGTQQIDPGSVRANHGDPPEHADDPRPANFRNVPPFGGGI
jgi:hypothetical protein